MTTPNRQRLGFTQPEMGQPVRVFRDGQPLSPRPIRAYRRWMWSAVLWGDDLTQWIPNATDEWEPWE